MADALAGGKYQLQEEIGRGGCSRVFLAWDKLLRKEWAVKRVSAGDSRALQEARLLGELDHPAFPRVVELIREGPYIYIVMDLVRGSPLAECLSDEPLPEEKALSYALQICEILMYLHAKDPPVIYRDLKPANLILTRDDRIMIVDFGAARRYRRGKPKDTQPLGTPGYAAPEQYGRAQSDERSDIYAFGMVLYRMLTGCDPADPAFRYVPVRRAAPHITEGTAAVTETCLRPEPDDRYQTCGELLRDLEKPGRKTAAFQKARRRGIHFLILIFSLSAILFLCGIFFRGLSQYINEQTYQYYLRPPASLADKEREASYLHACAMRPMETEPYMLLIRFYETEGTFGREESAHFSGAFEEGRDVLPLGDEDGKALLRSAAMLFFYGYEEGNASDRVRMLLALPYLELLCGEEDGSDQNKDADRAEQYLAICRFYESYEGNLTGIEEPDRGQYETLLQAASGCLQDISGKRGEEAAPSKERLTFCQSILRLIAEHAAGFASVGIPETDVRLTVDDLLRCARETSPLTEGEIARKKRILEETGTILDGIREAYRSKEGG